ncbi:MAG: rhodanese-related sulfurtransferase [Firmicutes bacterium HGW-Firmicutes-14]|nr:MAG: rhodanese-related sulfurtransferase [Firmicutes bacterium HGW-Firmicutes-14]
MSVLKRIEDWFSRNCNGHWEVYYGISIDTLDTPGWVVDIPLFETKLEYEQFDNVDIFRSDSNWVRCTLKKGVFRGTGGPRNLEEILEIFCDWAHRSQASSAPQI